MKSRTALFLTLALCSVVFVSCGGDDDDDNDVLNGSSVGLDKVRRADARAKALNPLARIVWAGGRRSAGTTMNDPAQADTWDFNAIADDGSAQLAGIWELVLLNNQWVVNELEYPPLEIEYIDLTSISMDVSEAWQLLEQAGLAEPFFTWELLKSLHPDYPNPFYAFYVGNGRYLFVDIVTRTLSIANNAPGIPAGPSLGAYDSRVTVGGTAGVSGGASIAMISAATQQIKSAFPDAFIVWAQGISAAETMSDPMETTLWNFVAVDDVQTPARSWDMSSDGTSWSVNERESLPSGILYLDLSGIWMDVTAAWSLVEENGLAQRFSGWELSFLEDGERPLFVFAKIAGGNIYVDAISGQAWDD